MTAVRLTVLAFACALAASGCTLLWLFNNDPEGLPCDFEDSKVGRCLEGYTCVGGVCIKAGNKEIGEVCARKEECKDGLACATAFRACAEGDGGGDDVNCALLDEDEVDLRCRQICETVDDTVCARDERCYLLSDVDGVPGVCQPGTCASNTECERIQGSPSLCANVLDQGERNGLCLERCNPLSCRATGRCTGCDGLDGLADEGLTCVPFPGRPVDGDNHVCDAFGTTPDFEACGAPGQDLCRFGSFCIGLPEGALCVPWCAFPNGNPECPAGRTCQAINGQLGFCL